jgi:hypothetical protein
MAEESYWTYKTSSPTPSLEEAIRCGAIQENSTEFDWYKLTPGMRREVVRSHLRRTNK